jgi:UDP-N-acetylglucosamine--N-acetylmuramyl-(pentapeptide) pyrophosphoryl-undecaprenol N-acetylglucosamine transferase
MIMAGGTGGHVMPGLAVASEMKSRSWNVVWLGVPGSMEADLVPKHGIPMQWVRMSGLRGKGIVRTLLLPFNLLRGFWQSILALRATKPNVVLGMGGYVAFPGAMMAVLLNRPLVIHEQNSVAGLTNKVLSHIADRILEAFPDSLSGAQCVGNPLRSGLVSDADPAQRFASRSGPLKLLVIGGSLGAKVLNDTVPAAVANLPAAQRPQITHQSGRAHREALIQNYKEAGVDAQVVDFIDDVASEYRQADLVVCRAGAMTVAELAAVGAAGILVPYPYAVDDHQTRNAAYLADNNAAVLINQSEFSAQWLAGKLTELNREALAAMASRAFKLSKPNAASEVADACESVARDVTEVNA